MIVSFFGCQIHFPLYERKANYKCNTLEAIQFQSGMKYYLLIFWGGKIDFV